MKKFSEKQKKTFRIVTNTISTVVFVIMILFIGVIMFQRIAVGESEIFGFRFFVILTDSMTPDLAVGTVIASKEVDPEELAVGDVVTYIPLSGALKGQNVTHKIVRIYTDDDGVLTIVTKGVKTGATEDNPVPASQVKGKMVGELKLVAKIFNVLKTPYGFIGLIVLPLVAVMVMFIVGYFQAAGKEKTEKLAQDAAKKQAEADYLEQLKREHEDEENSK